MPLFKVEIASKQDTSKVKIDEIFANNEQELTRLYDATGWNINKILDVQREENPYMDQHCIDANNRQAIEEDRIRIQVENEARHAAGIDPLSAEEINKMEVSSHAQKSGPPQSIPKPVVAKEVIFEDNGFRYKLIGEEVYKEDWVECKKDNYMIVKKTKTATKDITDEVIIKRKDWIRLRD